jgi:transposase
MQAHARRVQAEAARAVVGIDAGKFSHTLVVRLRGGADSRPFAFEVSRAGFEEAAAMIRASSGGAPPDACLVAIEFAGTYGFTLAHHLHGLGYPVVSVLPAHTKRWKEVTHHQPLKTDAKDAAGIVDLAAHGHFVGFPFLAPAYAELRYLASTRARLVLLQRACLTRLRSLLHVVFPEFEQHFGRFTHRTPLALLAAFPGPGALLEASPRQVLALLRKMSHGQCGIETARALRASAKTTVGLPQAQGALREELPLLVHQYALYQRQRVAIEGAMAQALAPLPETPALLSIPLVAPVTAGIFLGSIGDPQVYASAQEVLSVAGLTLVERSSGIRHGQKRISKRGRPILRAAAYMLAVRSIKTGGLFRAEYEGLIARNGGQRLKAVVAVSRSAIRLLFSIARDRRQFTPEPPGPRVHRQLSVPEA